MLLRDVLTGEMEAVKNVQGVHTFESAHFGVTLDKGILTKTRRLKRKRRYLMVFGTQPCMLSPQNKHYWIVCKSKYVSKTKSAVRYEMNEFFVVNMFI